jgi:hypothetical protein
MAIEDNFRTLLVTKGWRGVSIVAIAEQMTLYESEIFCDIGLNEMLIWKRDDKKDTQLR